MRKVLLFTSFAVLSYTAIAQHDRFAFAVTDVDHVGSSWTVLRKFDLQSGEFSNVILDGMKSSMQSYDAATKKNISGKSRCAKRNIHAVAICYRCCRHGV